MHKLKPKAIVMVHKVYDTNKHLQGDVRGSSDIYIREARRSDIKSIAVLCVKSFFVESSTMLLELKKTNKSLEDEVNEIISLLRNRMGMYFFTISYIDT